MFVRLDAPCWRTIIVKSLEGKLNVSHILEIKSIGDSYQSYPLVHHHLSSFAVTSRCEVAIYNPTKQSPGLYPVVPPLENHNYCWLHHHL